jgi:tetratricopeptide (TPR) repeat protein
LLLCFWATGTFAADSSQRSSIARQVAELLERQQHEAAYELAAQHATSEEGDPDFDFHYGLAALETGRPEEASFVFERLVALYPENDRFRLEYARALYRIKRHAEAEKQFRIVLEHNPPAAVVSNIERFIEHIAAERDEATKRWEGFVELGAGYDSNINNATGDRVIGLFELPDSAVEMDSPYLSARTLVKYHWPFSQRNRAFVQLHSDHKHNTENSDFDLDTVGLTSAWVHQRGAEQFQTGLQYQHTWLDGEAYQRSSGLFGQWRHFWGSQVATTLYSGLFDKHSFQLDELDVLQPIVSAQLQVLAGSFLHQLSVGGGTENPRVSGGRHLAKDFTFAGYQLLWQTSDDYQPFAGISGFRGRYKEEHPVFGERREDDAYQLSVGVTGRLAEELSLTLETSYTDNDSNLGLYEYTRWRVEARLQRAF